MELIIKGIVIFLLLNIIYNLFKAMFSMLKGDPNAPSMSHFIGRRLMFTAVLMVILLVLLGLDVLELNPSPYRVNT